MKRMPVSLKVILLAGFLVPLPKGWTQQDQSPLDKYRQLELPPKKEDIDKVWKDHVALEFEIINGADIDSLRTALKDPNRFVRAMAARALGIRGDKSSAEALADLVKADPEPMVRSRAVESLGYLKMKADVIQRAQKDASWRVQWSAKGAAGRLERETDYAALVRQAYAVGIEREAIGSAKVGQPAPDFSALTSEGKPFKLSDVLGKKAIAIYFAAEDT